MGSWKDRLDQDFSRAAVYRFTVSYIVDFHSSASKRDIEVLPQEEICVIQVGAMDLSFLCSKPLNFCVSGVL